MFRYHLGSARKEKVLGRYPELSLKEARELCRLNRSQGQQGVDVGALKRLEKMKAHEHRNVSELAQAWYERHIADSYEHPEVVLRIIRRHIDPALGPVSLRTVRPVHVDRLLTDIVDSGARPRSASTMPKQGISDKMLRDMFFGHSLPLFAQPPS